MTAIIARLFLLPNCILEAYAGAGNGTGHGGKGINGHVSVNGNGTGTNATKVKVVGGPDGSNRGGYGIGGDLTVEGTANVEIYGGDRTSGNGGSINVSSSTPWYTHNGSSWSAGSPTNLTTTQTGINDHGVALPTDPTTLL